MRPIILLSFLCISFSGICQSTDNTPPCFNKDKLRNLCMFVGSRTPAPNPLSPRYEYLYQRRILEAACVDINKDSEEEIQKKVAAMWKVVGNEMICNNLAFDVKDGSLLKYGLVTKFDRFVYDICKWKIDLNKVGESDNRTLLDYVQFQMERNKGTSIEKKLQDYYRQLRTAGAKHRSEL